MIYNDERDVVYFTDEMIIKMLAGKSDYSDARPYVAVGIKEREDEKYLLKYGVTI